MAGLDQLKEGSAPEAATAEATPRATGRIAQFKRQLAGMSYDEQVAAVAPGRSAVQFAPGPPPPAAPPIDMANVVASVKAFCSSDPIAMQKLADVDGEQYYDGGNPKAAFYTAIGTFINSNPTTPKATIYNACFNNCAYPYKGKGKKVPESRLSPHLYRTNGFSTYFDYQVDASHKTNYLNRAQMSVPTGLASKDLAMKLLRRDIRGGAPVESFIASGAMLTPTGRSGWYSTDEINFSPSTETNFDGLLELNALQPEFFADGTVSYKIAKSAFLKGASNDLRKPTAYDGMQSSLWTARNLPGNAFGVTGGGASEFLASDIAMSAVEEYTASLPDEDMVTALKTLQEAAQAHLLASDPVLKAKYDTAKAKLDTLAPTDPGFETAFKDLDRLTWALPNLVDEVLRGQDVDLRGLMLTKATETLALVDQIIERMNQERANPSNRSSRPSHDLN